MRLHELLIAISPYPIIDLSNPEIPSDGILAATPAICRRHWEGGECLRHYQAIRERGVDGDSPIPCPYGFSTVAVTSKSTSFAITAIVPYPRVGSTSERRNAKAYPDNKVPVARIESIAKELLRALKAYLDFETTAYRQAAMAIHEIRKLNAVVKQTAERLGQPGRMPSEEDLLRIRKTSDMMSQIFTAIHVLADESIAKLPMNSRSEIYKLIEKVLWIYTPETSEVGVSFHSLPRGYSGPVNACDVTLPLIPSALIQNAFQYATPGTTIDVVVAQAEDCRSVEVRVSNQCRRHAILDDRVFDKGIRFSSDIDGSGHGLYIAKLVAKQHRGDLRVQSQMLDSETCLCTFVLTLPQMAN